METYFLQSTAFVRYYLLIEPVWNGNLSRCPLPLRLALLLIEPVWNGNVIDRNLQDFVEVLLIKPLWNANMAFGLRSATWTIF